MSDGRNVETDPLAEIVRRCHTGQHSAQRELHDACQQDLFGLMMLVVGGREAADMTQPVFLQAFCKIGQFQGQSKFQN